MKTKKRILRKPKRLICGMICCIFLGFLLNGCAAQKPGTVNVSDGVNKQEAVILARKFVTDKNSGFGDSWADPRRIRAVRHYQAPAPERMAYWQVTFDTYSGKDLSSREFNRHIVLKVAVSEYNGEILAYFLDKR